MTMEERIKEQFPALFITLLSVLIGLVFSDLVTEARARMQLWPLSLGTLRTWAQLLGNGSSAVLVWIVLSHIGISRRHVPTLGDSLMAIILPMILLAATSLVGQNDIWPWFYAASSYLVISIGAFHWSLRLAVSDTELAHLKQLLHPAGLLSVLYIGAPFYALAGWLDQHRLLSPLFEVLCAASPIPASLIGAHLFFRDWRRAIVEPSRPASAP